MAKSSGSTRATNSRTASASRMQNGFRNAEKNRTTKTSSSRKYDMDYFDGHVISEATPQKINKLKDLLSKMKIDNKLTQISSTGETSPFDTGRTTEWGDTIMTSEADAAELIIKAREEDSFSFGARMFVEPTDDGYYRVTTSNRIQSYKKDAKDYPNFAYKILTEKEAIAQIKLFKKFYNI